MESVSPAQASARLLGELRALANPHNVEGMARFGINAEGTLGVSVADTRRIARSALQGRRRDAQWRHDVALRLWDSGVHEARILASIVEDPAMVTLDQAHAWASDFDSWDVCDQTCMNLLRHTPIAWQLAEEWVSTEPEFVRRAGFALIASLVARYEEYGDEPFLRSLAWIRSGAGDDRALVRKAVSWALRQIGKRSQALYAPALEVARELASDGDRRPRWVGRDAQRELESAAVRTRLGVR